MLLCIPQISLSFSYVLLQKIFIFPIKYDYMSFWYLRQRKHILICSKKLHAENYTIRSEVLIWII